MYYNYCTSSLRIRLLALHTSDLILRESLCGLILVWNVWLWSAFLVFGVLMLVLVVLFFWTSVTWLPNPFGSLSGGLVEGCVRTYALVHVKGGCALGYIALYSLMIFTSDWLVVYHLCLWREQAVIPWGTGLLIYYPLTSLLCFRARKSVRAKVLLYYLW